MLKLNWSLLLSLLVSEDSDPESRPLKRASEIDSVQITRKTRSRQKSNASESGLRRSVDLSDEDSADDLKGSKNAGAQPSRIDKWKAKHEAMLKLAEEGKKKKDEDEEDEPEVKVTDDDDEPPVEGKEAGRVVDVDEDEDDEDDEVAEQEKEKENNDLAVDLDAAAAAAAASGGGVCIDLAQQQQRKGSGKPHTRHNSAVQQQALSV